MSRQIYLEHAQKIGYQLYRDAVWHQDRCNWMSKEYDLASGGSIFTFQPMQGDFYKGLPGVALFLAGLYRETGETRFRTAAIGASRQSLRLLDGIAPEYRFSFFRGWTGVALSACLVARNCGETSLEEDAYSVLQRLLREDISGARLDVIDGVAGGLPALIALESMLELPELRTTIEVCGQYLLEQAVSTPEGVYWRTHPHQPSGMPGFSHGAAGIAWCLFEMYGFTRNEVFLQYAKAALEYEENILLAGSQAFEINPVAAKKDWAHGSAGLALARWKAYLVTGETACLNTAKGWTAASCQAFENSLWMDISPCNGVWGLTDTLLLGSRIAPEEMYLDKAGFFARQAIRQWEKMGEIWVDGMAGKTEVPDFMISLSGVGYSLLRLIDPVQYPSVLAIDADAMAAAAKQGVPEFQSTETVLY